MQRMNTRRESRNIAGRFRGGKLAPAMAVPFLGGEGGMLSQTATVELDRIAGRIVTPISLRLVSVYVPVQAIDAIKAPDAEYAGMTEVLRQKLLSGNPLFGLENETEISKRLGVEPRSIGGVKKVNEAARLAHNAAVNFLRKRKYVYATEIPHTHSAVTPALLGSTVLERLNGVLDPDDRINGQVELSFPDVNLPLVGNPEVSGLTVNSVAGVSSGSSTTFQLDKAGNVVANGSVNTGFYSPANVRRASGNTVAGFVPPTVNLGVAGVFAQLNGFASNGVRLTDFYTAQRVDELVREMRRVADENPMDGEDMVLRWAHGLSVDTGRHPFVLYEAERIFGETYRAAMDGVGLMDEVAVTENRLQVSFTVPVPRTELGGIVITFLSVVPDETIAHQPHPILSAPWGAINQVADELKLDPVPVTMREVNADVPQASENTVAFYTGHNELKKAYVNYGFNRHLDPTTVENKTAIWQLEIPASVTPENIIYPENLSHYPFLDQSAEVATYTLRSEAVIKTPLYFGPSPVETLAVIDDAEILE